MLHKKCGIEGTEEEEDERNTKKKKYNGEGKVEEIGTSHVSYKEERRGMKRERGRKSRR